MKKQMKKLLAALLCLFLMGANVSVSAKNRGNSGEMIDVEKMIVIINPEYVADLFLPAYFGSDIVARVEPSAEGEDDKLLSAFRVLDLYLNPVDYDTLLDFYEKLSNDEKVYRYYVIFDGDSSAFCPPRPYVYYGTYLVTVSADNSDGYLDKNMLFNPYYQQNYDRLLKRSAEVAERHIDDPIYANYVQYYAENGYLNAGDYVTLIFKTPENSALSVHAYTAALCEKYLAKEDILYVGDSVYAAVVAVNKQNIDAFMNMPELVFIGDAFFDLYGLISDVVGERTLGLVYEPESEYIGNGNKMTAANARYILRYSAGLEEHEMTKQFGFCADMNFDNQITAADARLALRTAAKLEPKITLSFGYEAYWYDCGYYGYTDLIDNVT